MTSYGNLIPNL